MAPTGCKPESPLEGVLAQLIKAAKTGDKAALEALVDADTSHKLLTARLVLLLPKDKQNDAFKQANGETAHTACLGFGMERVVMALFKHHGFVVEEWPKSVRAQLWP